LHRRFITLLLYALSALLFVGYVLALATAAQNNTPHSASQSRSRIAWFDWGMELLAQMVSRPRGSTYPKTPRRPARLSAMSSRRGLRTTARQALGMSTNPFPCGLVSCRPTKLAPAGDGTRWTRFVFATGFDA